MEKYRVCIGFSGVGGGKLPKEKFWMISTDYTAWKFPNEKLQNENGRITILGDNQKLAEMRQGLQKNTIVEILAEKEGAIFRLQDIIQSNVLPDEDERLFIEEQEKPVLINDNILGELILDKTVNWFAGNINYNGKQISISFEDETDILLGHELLANIDQIVEDAKNYAADELLELGNDWYEDAWNEEEKGEFISLSKEDFVNLISLENINFSEDQYTLWFNDGNIFWGHIIAVSWNEEDGYHDAGMHG